MFSNRMERRKFLKAISSTLVGLAAPGILKPGSTRGENTVASKVQYRMLGRTGLKVTAVSMGVMNCSDAAVLHRAFDLGINFYDTADCYMQGRNEEMVGRVFKGRRDKVFIQTKVHDGDEKKMRGSVERSLRRLQTDYVDVLVWHGLHSTDEISNAGLYEFMERMKKEGKTRFTGFSAHSNMAAVLVEASKTKFHDVALVSYNFTHSKKLKDAVALASDSGIGVIAMKTQSGGYNKERMQGLTPHQAALNFILNDPHVSAAVPGVTTIEQIEECAAVMSHPLTKGDLSALRGYRSFLQGRVCTMCGGCIGECPYEVPHQDLLRLVMYHDGYQSDSLVKESLENISKEDLQHCLDCSSCSLLCRSGVDIRAQIQSIQRFLS